MILSSIRVFGDAVEDGNASYHQRDWDAAIGHYTKAIEQNAASNVAYFDRGMAKMAKSDIDGAIADYTKAIELKPDHWTYYNNRANAKMAKRDVDDAIADYTKAIELNTNYADAYLNRAFARSGKGDALAALGDYSKTLTLKPDCWQAYLGRATVEYIPNKQAGNVDFPLMAGDVANKIEAALADYTKAIELNPNAVNARKGRAYLLLLQWSFDPASSDSTKSQNDLNLVITDCSKIIESEPANASVYCQRGIAQNYRGNLNGALQDFGLALQIDPANLKALVNRGIIRQKQKESEKALVDFNQAKTLHPDQALLADINHRISQIFFDRAKDKWLADDADGALSDLNQTIELNPRNTEAYKDRALAEQKQHDYQGAKVDLEKYLELAPGDSEARDAIDKLNKYLNNR
ncbi:MAG TPA: tetratricopeptide repeat protein [Verrucomicrobiae bacterium]